MGQWKGDEQQNKSHDTKFNLSHANNKFFDNTDPDWFIFNLLLKV